MKISKIIVASHGTPGARAAEDAALELCSKNKASLHHMLIVPDFWKGMMGDDWLNNVVTQIRFGKYVENQLAMEASEEIERAAKAAALLGVPYSSDFRLGKPAECLVETCDGESFDLAVIGSPRPKGAPGYRSRMVLDPLVRSLNVRLMIIPHPER